MTDTTINTSRLLPRPAFGTWWRWGFRMRVFGSWIFVARDHPVCVREARGLSASVRVGRWFLEVI